MILKHRDLELLRFEWTDLGRPHVTSVNEAAMPFMPLDFKGEVSDASLFRWMRHRAVPKNRAYIQSFLSNLGIKPDDLRAQIEFCHGLSLNDVHWVDDGNSRWAAVNLYANEFSDTLAFMAFTGAERSVEPGSSSPELTTNGMLAKCWRRMDGQPVLFKSGTEGAANCGFEPYSEYYAAQLAEALGLDHVSYGLEMFKTRLCSTCPIFTSDKYGYISAGRLMTKEEALADARFGDIFFFDALICNPDRHLGNFGYLVDNDTNKIVGAAPIFDNGYGLFSLALYRNKYADEFADLGAFASHRSPALYAKWLGFPTGLTPEMLSRLERLRGFRFKAHPYYNLPAERVRLIEDFLQNRISKIIEYHEKADEFLEICGKDDNVNRKSNVAHETINRVGERPNETKGPERVKQEMRADPFVSYDELSEMIGVSRATIARWVSKLVENGEIERVGSRKTGSWKVL